MSQYPLILATLLEFDLITADQHEAAYAEWYDGMADYERRRDEFRDKWQAERAALPWWKRMNTSTYGWASEWFKQEEETA